jgi:hypothetical protein
MRRRAAGAPADKDAKGLAMTHFGRWVALVMAICAGGCLPVTSKVPVGTTVGFKADPALFGVWRGKSQGDETASYLTFTKLPNGDLGAVLVASANNTSDGDLDVYDVKVASLGGHHFLSARGLFANGRAVEDWPADVTAPVLYRVEGNTLSLFLLDEDATANAIRSGALQGTVEADTRNQDGTVAVHGDVHVTEDGPALDAFLQSPKGLALFKTLLIRMQKVE